MLRYVLRRVLWTLVMLVVITLVSFLLFRVLPTADPARLRAGKSQDPATLAAIRENLGLDRPLSSQYGDFLAGVFTRFDFGRSYITDAPIGPQLLDAVGETAWLVAGAVVLWLATGLAVGVLSALRRGSLWDRAAMGAALVAVSAPVYWLGLVALFVLASDIGVVPVFPGAGAFGEATTWAGRAWAMVLPWCVLAASFSAVYARLLRSSLLEAMGQDHIRTARATGLSERRVVRRGVRTAITPVVTALGVDVGLLVGGNAILTETVFGIDGVGRMSFRAIERGDLATIQATVLFLALVVCLAALLVDLLYVWLDPRVSYA